MKRQTVREQVVRDFARLPFEESLPDEARLAIVEAAINQEVTITEMLRETVNLEAFGFPGKAHEMNGEGLEEDLVLIHCPS